MENNVSDKPYKNCKTCSYLDKCFPDYTEAVESFGLRLLISSNRNIARAYGMPSITRNIFNIN